MRAGGGAGPGKRRLWLLAPVLAVLAVVTLFPQIDLGVSARYYDAARNFWPARTDPWFEWFRKDMPYLLFGLAAAVTALWGLSEILKRPVLGVGRRVGAFLLASLALGPGLVVNLLLKDNWGRPRPSTLVQFGGSNTYVPPLVPSDQCDYNCSFTSGHGALGFWLVSFALVAPPAWRRPALAATLAFGAYVGFVRIAQGGHFLSDVVFSAVITIGLSILLHRYIVERGQSRSPKNNRADGGEMR